MKSYGELHRAANTGAVSDMVDAVDKMKAPLKAILGTEHPDDPLELHQVRRAFEDLLCAAAQIRKGQD